MIDKEEAIKSAKADMDAWNGINKYLFQKAKKEYNLLTTDSTAKAPKYSKPSTTGVEKGKEYTWKELKAKNMAELRSLAKSYGLSGYSKLREDSLIRKIMYASSK